MPSALVPSRPASRSPALLTLLLAALLGAVGCPTAPADDDDSTGDDDDSTGDDDDSVNVPDTYAFNGPGGTSSVVHDGQTFRHVLIEDLKKQIGGLTARLDNGWFPVAGDVTDELDFYLLFDGDTSGSVAHGIVTTPAPVQTVYNDIASGKDLMGKVAGNDLEGQHQDWTTEFVGWGAAGGESPSALIAAWIATLDAQAVAWSQGTYPLDPAGASVSSVFLTAQGQDLQQLLQKFLLGAITFSQGADDYLDDDLPGKGLLSPHGVLVAGQQYSELEHAWDEAFGYFGAAHDYGDWTDAELGASISRDTVVVDGAIDLGSEVCWGTSVNAGKRDLGSAAAAPTDFSGRAWNAFLGGRALLDSTDAALTEAQRSELREFRDAAVRAWEEAIAATIVHYINEVLVDVGTFGTADYSFTNHAKHWSEGKGFALGLQFNPRSPLGAAEFAALHEAFGTAPVLPGDAGLDDFVAGLLDARDALGLAYGFDAANLGDEGGVGGW